MRRAIDLVVRLPRWVWRKLSAGHGAHGERIYDWTWMDIRVDTTEPQPGVHGLLVRRNRSTGELAFYRTWSPDPVPLAELVAVAGRRWTIEENFQTGKELAALDEHQVRRWTSWRRWTVLSMLAHAFLTVLAARPTEPGLTDGEPAHRQPKSLIPLTRNEIRHLFTQLLQPPARTIAHILGWSFWRRHHEALARSCHYRRRGDSA